MKLIVATGNAHKADEIRQILGNQVEVLTLKDVCFKGEIIEDGVTFEANARIKAQKLADWVLVQARVASEPSLMILADDSGLEVDALHGEPGVHSARYAGEPSNDQANMSKLLQKLEGVSGPNRTARFRCVLAAIRVSGGEVNTFEGACPGKIGFKPKGERGFGYDPIFFPEGFCRTFAELDASEKNAMSHRARALQLFRTWLFP